VQCYKFVQGSSLVTMSKELSRGQLDLVGVQEVRWEGGTEPAGEYTFCYGKRNESHELRRGFSLSHVILRGCWCQMIFLTQYGMKARGGSECMDPGFLVLGNTCKRVVSFTLRTALPLETEPPQCPLNRRLGGPQSRSERCGEAEILGATGTRTSTLSKTEVPL
jgi:hypothetical protein